MLFLCKVYVLRHSKMQDFFQRSLAFIPTASACSTTVPTPEGTKSKTEQIVWQKKKSMQTNAKFLWLFKVGTFSHTRVCACVSLWFRAASYLQRAVSDPVRSADITQRHVKCQEYRGADDHRDRNSSVTHTHSVVCGLPLSQNSSFLQTC